MNSAKVGTPRGIPAGKRRRRSLTSAAEASTPVMRVRVECPAMSAHRPSPAAALVLTLAAFLGLGVCGMTQRNTPHPEVLIVVNGASPMSVAIGEYYRQKRNVPTTKVVTLSVPLADPNLGNSVQETITTQATFDAQIRTPIQNFLTSNGLVDQIVYIVIASGVPVRYTPSAATPPTCMLTYAQYVRDCARASVDAELAVLFSTLPGAGGVGPNGEAKNPYYDSNDLFQSWRTAHPTAPLKYLVARLAGFQPPVDAPTGIPTDIKNLIDRANATATTGTVLVDQDPSLSVGLRAGNAIWLNPVAALVGGLGVTVNNETTSTYVS